ncbi:MAG: ABC transporter substrate-binding protein [Bacteroidia bacterium]
MRKCAHPVVVLFFAELLFGSCSTYKPKSSEVVSWQLSDPSRLNPVLAYDNVSIDIDNNIFQPLLNFDYKTLKLVPVLADSLPDVKIAPDGQMLITFEIRKEAKWDNGSPVTAKDALFTLKTIKIPLINDEALRPYYDMVNDIITYAGNPGKFTIVYGAKYASAVTATGTDTYILPEYVYDSAKYLENFTFKQICSDTGIASEPKVIAFAKEFNSVKYSREPGYVSGSGAYKFVEWTTGQRIVLKKKDNWWGDVLVSNNCFFEAYPSTLVYQTINDMTSALVSLKAGNIDAINYIKPPDFSDLSKSEKFAANFNLYNIVKFGYTYIGLNMTNPKFSDLNARKAIAHLIDVPRIINDVYYGYAKQVIGPVSPMDSLDYYNSIMPYIFNIDTAKALLAAAGWKDSDGDGILDKVIDGKKTDFTIDFLSNSGNEQRKRVGLIFKEEARKAGISVNVIQQDNNIYMENLKTHHFEMYMYGWVLQPGPQDYKPIFYTTSALNKGSNFTCFGDAESDALIDSIRMELDPVKSSQMIKRLQSIMHEQCGYIFLFAPEALIAINKKFSNAYPSPDIPCYWEAGFKTDKD